MPLPSPARLAARWLQSAAKTVTVYHGTTAAAAAKIRSSGLVSQGYDRPQWHMVAEDIPSAAHHAYKGGTGDFVVLEFRVPTEPKMRGGRERYMWDGYPYLWKPHTIDWEGSGRTRWWALRQPLPPEFITRVHKASPPQVRTASYDPESWYYRYEPGTPLQTVIDRWQKDRPGLDRRGNPLPRQKVYEDSMPVMLTVRELWPLREYTWTRENSRGGFAKVNGKSVQLPGPLKWDALKEDMRLRGWNPRDPLLLEIGSEGGVKVGEGNHRLAIARELGIQKVSVEFQFKTYRVRKQKQHRLPTEEVSPKALKKVVEKEVDRVERETKPTTPEEQAEMDRRVDELMKLLGM